MQNVRHLAVFRAVVQAGSISRAARTLHVTQPAVTKTIRILEEELGISLFVRIKGRLAVTPEGELLIPAIERLLSDVGAVKGLADEIRQGFSGSLTIASVTTLSTSLVANALERFNKRYPQVRVDIKAMSTMNTINYVAVNHVDIGVVDALPIGFDMEVIELCQSELGCVMPGGHSLARKRFIAPQDLTGHTLISFGADTRAGLQLREAFRDAAVLQPIAFTVNHTLSAYSLVRRGVGIAIVDSFPILSGEFEGLVFLPFQPAVVTTPRAVFSKRRAVPIVARHFVATLLECADELIALPGSLLKAAPRKRPGLMRKP